MITAGELLYNARLKKRLTLEQVEKATKIRAKFLAAIEKNDFASLPPTIFVKGFLRSYASFLNLSPIEVLAFYRRQVNEDKKPPLPPPQKYFAVPLFLRSTAVILGIVIALILFLGYLVFSYRQLTSHPTLIINYPPPNITLAAETVEIVGKTDPDAQLSLNGQAVPVLENGSFSVKIPLTPGVNTLTITAANKFRRQTTVTRYLRFEK